MCSTSCRLTEPPLAYVWYRNGEVLYDDWSPWYQELVGSDRAVAYSCAVKGREDLRAPDVSVGEWGLDRVLVLMSTLDDIQVPYVFNQTRSQQPALR